MSHKTVFVIGAGAGVDIGMPLGAKLAAQIATTLQKLVKEITVGEFGGNSNIAAALTRKITEEGSPYNIEKYRSACNAIVTGMQYAESIDNFLNLNRDSEDIALCGKLAIASHILAAERACNIKSLVLGQLSVRDQNRIKLRSSWLHRLQQLLTRDAQFAGVIERLERTTFINFNYDRCLETYLCCALREHCGESAEDVAQAIAGSTIIHPYGTVGSLPWQNNTEFVEFGNENVGEKLLDIADGIKTFHEQVADKAVVEHLRYKIENADRIVFVGFAYHPMNMKLIRPPNPSNAGMIVGSSFGISADNQTVVQNELASQFVDRNPPIVHLKHLECEQFMEFFDRRMSYS